jgi:hypothetical protein
MSSNFPSGYLQMLLSTVFSSWLHYPWGSLELILVLLFPRNHLLPVLSEARSEKQPLRIYSVSRYTLRLLRAMRQGGNARGDKQVTVPWWEGTSGLEHRQPSEGAADFKLTFSPKR